jgi:hypothetical protein
MIKMHKNSSSMVGYTVIYNIVISIPSILDGTILFKNYAYNLYNDLTELMTDLYNHKSKIPEDVFIDSLDILIHNLQDTLNQQIAIYAVDNDLYPLNKIFLP